MYKNYLVTAFRNLWKHTTFSLINVLGLAVGMTACFLIFLYIKHETSYDNFHSKADRIYRIVSDVKTPSETIHSGITIAPLAIELKKEFPEVEDAVRIAGDDFLVKIGAVKFQEEQAALADSTLFNVFDFPLIAGDKNTALKEPMSIVLSETAARKYFGKTNALGQRLLLSGNAINATVTGIMKDIPANSQVKAEMLVSMSSSKQLYGRATSDSEWTNHSNYENRVYVLPKVLDEKVARLHLAKIGVELDELSEAQSEYLGISKEGPFKTEMYRY